MFVNRIWLIYYTYKWIHIYHCSSRRPAVCVNLLCYQCNAGDTITDLFSIKKPHTLTCCNFIFFFTPGTFENCKVSNNHEDFSRKIMKKFKTRFRGSTDLKMNFWLQKYVYFVTDIIFLSKSIIIILTSLPIICKKNKIL